MPGTAKKRSKFEPRSNEVENIPPSIRSKICKIVGSFSFDDGESSSAVAKQIEKVFCDELDIQFVSREDIQSCLDSKENTEKKHQQLKELAAKNYAQTKRALRAFELLDEAGKGCVVVEDLQRVANEILGEDGQTTEDDLIEMIQQFDQSGDGVLSKDDFIRIARQVGLWSKKRAPLASLQCVNHETIVYKSYHEKATTS